MTMGEIQEYYDKSGSDEEINQLVEQLEAAKKGRLYVGLDWFREEFFPGCDLPWAHDTKKIGDLLQQAIEQRVILTWRVVDPNHPLKSVTTIWIDWEHPRFDGSPKRPLIKFAPIKIKGGMISDTVIEDRADRI